MTMKRLLSLALLGLPLIAAARPADPRPAVMTNPDGTKVTIRAFGDEHFNYYTDAEQTTILECKDGYWTPAVRDGQTLLLNQTNIERLRAEVPEFQTRTLSARAPQHRMATLESDGRTTYPTISTADEPIHALVVLWEFADTKFTIPDHEKMFDRMLNEEGFSEYNALGSARDYYLACSNGQFNIKFDVAPTVKLKYNRTWYNGNETNESRHRYIGNCIQEAIEQLDPVIDFSKYDYDKDGIIDNIFFFYAGYGQADSHDVTCFWPHQGTYQSYIDFYGLPVLTPDGVRMATYACSNELNATVPAGWEQPYLDGIGAFCHEYGHVLGLPDLYDTQDTGCKEPRKYDLMGSGSYNENSTCPPLFSAYEQWACKWLEFDEITEPGTYTMNALTGDNRSALRVRAQRPPRVTDTEPRYFNEYLIMETRKHEGWDSSLPEEGVFLWRVYFVNNVWTSNTVCVNVYGRNQVPYWELINSTKDTYSFPGAEVVTFTYPEKDEYAVKWQCSTSSTRPWVTSINYDAEQGIGSLNYNVVTELISDATVLHDTPEQIGEREIKLTWDPVDGAEYYELTAYRTDASGKQRFINGLDAFNVGKETSWTLTNLTNTAWKQEFTCYVRVIKGVPSKETSNVLKFTPAEFFSAVEGIESDNAPIYGVQGGIVAPEGAEIFNLGGVRTGTENLPAGLYIVRYNGRTEKVIVK